MENASLVAWAVSAALGSLLALTWFLGGGLRRRDADESPSVDRPVVVGPDPGRTRIPAWIIGTHPIFALLVLLLWLDHVAREDDSLASGAYAPVPWTVFALLLAVAGLGDSMYLRWRRARKQAKRGLRPGDSRSAEQRMPSALVHLHALAATVTTALVLLVALGVD